MLLEDVTKYDQGILVNQDHNLGTQHFTIAHQLYHLLIQENFGSKSCITGQFDKRSGIEEYKADMFAAYFLLPEDGLKLGIPPSEYTVGDSIRLETVLKLEQYYSVSRRAILQRLKNMNIISSTLFDRYTKEVKKSAAAYGYELDLYTSGNKDLVIGDYGVLAHSLFEQEKISESHCLELMRAIGFYSFEAPLNDND